MRCLPRHDLRRFQRGRVPTICAVWALPIPGARRVGEHRATSPALALPEGIPRDPPPLICTKAASLTSACVMHRTPKIPGEGELLGGCHWETARSLEQHARLPRIP